MSRGRPELIGARKSRFVVYALRKGEWERDQTLKGRHEANAQKLTVADYDNDGDPDVFAASKSGSTLLVNGRGGLRPRGPEVGRAPIDGVDCELGRLRQRRPHRPARGPPAACTARGRATGSRARAWRFPEAAAIRAIASWFDFDSNGSRDAVLAVRHDDAGRNTDLSLLDNAGPVGRWLEVELTGPPGNRQAVGAKVSARAGERTQTQWVGPERRLASLTGALPSLLRARRGSVRGARGDVARTATCSGWAV